MALEIEKIGVLTSGGDAPGMNACIRAVVRAGAYYHKDVVGVMRGYYGLINGLFTDMKARSVGNIIHRGGTILKSARCEEFKTREGRHLAWQNLQEKGIDALVVIGGNGSFAGAHLLHEEFGVKVIGIPATIDNDLYGTDFCIGHDTATNTVVEAIDQIRDTAASHGRLFFIEVMGKDAGFIALRTGLAVGAEAMIVPERRTSIEELVRVLDRNWKSSKSFSLVIVAEAGESGRTFRIAKEVNQKLNYYDTKVTVLGHIQRGGSPSCSDRVLSSRLGVAAVEGLLEGRSGVMAGMVCGKIAYTPLKEAIEKVQDVEEELLRIAQILSI
jgi:6-phosphofructokinase 1